MWQLSCLQVAGFGSKLRAAFHTSGTNSHNRPKAVDGLICATGINDRFGHCGGDVVLVHVGRILAKTFRLSAVVVRYGGEEFCVVLHACAQADAAKYAERLVGEADRQSVRLRDGRSTGFTLSVGYASALAAADSDDRQESLQSVITRTNRALYRAKESGPNQCLSASSWELAVIAY